MRLPSARIAACSLLLCLGCWGGERNEPTTPGAAFDAGIVFGELTPEVVHKFRLVNTTGRDVRIKGVRRSCTCTEATADRTTVAPGEAVELTIKVKTQTIFRDWGVTSSLETDDPARPFWTCDLRFRTYPRWQFDQPALDLGTIPIRSAGTSSPEVYRLGFSGRKLDGTHAAAARLLTRSRRTWLGVR